MLIRNKTLTSSLLAITLCLSFAFAEDKEKKKIDPSSSTSFVVFPQDCNANPPMLFGGKLLSEMDRLAGITARRALYNSPLGATDAVTLSIKDMTFHHPARVKDLLTLSSKLTSVGTKTLTIKIQVHKEADPPLLIADATFIFCSFDLATSQAIPHGLPPIPALGN